MQLKHELVAPFFKSMAGGLINSIEMKISGEAIWGFLQFPNHHDSLNVCTKLINF